MMNGKTRIWRVRTAIAEHSYYSAIEMTPETFLAGMDSRFMGYAITEFKPLTGGEWVRVRDDD